MIRRLTPALRPRFLALLGEDPLFGGRLATAWDCYEDRPGLCSFYLAGGAGALLVQGGGAVLCGRLGRGGVQELALFLRFCGCGQLVARAGALPGLSGRPLAALLRPPGLLLAPRWPLPAGLQLETAPSLWQLRGARLPAVPDPDGWYADSCIRTRWGLARVWAAADGAGRPAATAGLYSLRQGVQGGYLAGVETRAPFRGRGAGRGLVAALADSCSGLPVRLLCSPALAPFYKKMGFVEEGAAVSCPLGPQG